MFETLFSEGGLSLERLRALVEVHDAGSIVHAAPSDTVRHSQYSRQLRDLAEFFGREVAERRGKLLKLTPEGLRLVQITRPFMRELEDFYAECRSERKEFSIAAGDSLIHWLVIPRLGDLQGGLPEARFTTVSLRTNEIVRQVVDSRVDFGLIRRNAMRAGLKCASLGAMNYVAVVPTQLSRRKSAPTFSEVIGGIPVAMQASDGQFASQLRAIAIAENRRFQPALGCQSFPQTLAAVRSGRYAAIVPELALQELPSVSIFKVSAERLRQLRRDVVLVWNPRTIKVRPLASRILDLIQKKLKF